MSRPKGDSPLREPPLRGKRQLPQVYHRGAQKASPPTGSFITDALSAPLVFGRRTRVDRVFSSASHASVSTGSQDVVAGPDTPPSPNRRPNRSARCRAYHWRLAWLGLWRRLRFPSGIVPLLLPTLWLPATRTRHGISEIAATTTSTHPPACLAQVGRVNPESLAEMRRLWQGGCDDRGSPLRKSGQVEMDTMGGYTPAGRMANDASSGQQKGTELLPGIRDLLAGRVNRRNRRPARRRQLPGYSSSCLSLRLRK